jgi:hypothetical protein
MLESVLLYTLSIKSEESIEYLYLNGLMFKIIFKVAEMIKHYFDKEIN